MSNPKVHRPSGATGGDEMIVESGGQITVKSGGEIEVKSGGAIDFEALGGLKIEGVAVTASAAQLNSVSAAITVANKTGGTLTKGTLVYLSGYDTTLGAPSVTVASLTAQATHVLTENIANNASGTADEEATIAGLDTSAASAVGALVYQAAAGAFSFSAATGADEIDQVVGVVVTKHASTGSIYFFPGYPNVRKIGTSGMQADSVTNTILNNMTRGTVKVGGESNVPTDLDAKTTGQLLIGDGTDIKSIAMKGDATIIADGTITVGADKIDNDKLANIARGSVKVGGTDNAPTDLDAKTDGQILIGDGTDIKSVAVSGDVTIANTGAVTIANDAVETAMIAADTALRYEDTADGTIPAYRLVEIDGSGDLVVGTVDSHTIVGANLENAEKTAAQAIKIAYSRANLVAATPIKGGHLLKCADNGRATHLVTAALTGGAMKTTGAGTAFTNQPANDSITVVSDAAGDTTQTLTVIGTTQGGTTVVTQDIVLNGTTPVASAKADWGVILALKLSAACAGTLTITETSGSFTITTIAPAATSKGVETVDAIDQGAYNVVPTLQGSDTTTKTIGVKYVNSAAADAYQAIALTDVTPVALGTAALLVSEIYTGDLEGTRTCTLKVGAEEDELHKIGYATEAAVVGATFGAVLSK